MSAHEESRLLSAYIDGELDRDERHRVEAHLGACASCRAREERLSEVKWAMAAARPHRAPADLVAALEARHGAAPGLWERVLGALRPPVVWVPAGALALAALVMGLWLYPAEEEEIPLEALSAAHSRYKAESHVPHGDLLASSFSASFESEQGEHD
ncbi:MAG: zf-HC2 domain-containing protein [Elusimicrobiota bacterium]|jgi:anti-sigma factor RsiW